MDQYYMPKKLDFKHLRQCINNYEADFLYIRLVGSCGGHVKVSEDLAGKKLNFKAKNGLDLIIDDKKVFHFTLKEEYTKGFSMAYERFLEDGRMHIHYSNGLPENPYDPKLPEVKRSYLRTCLDNHLMEIFFKGFIPIKFHSWLKKPYFKYWTVATKEEVKKLILNNGKEII